jgi:O-antigen ligase
VWISDGVVEYGLYFLIIFTPFAFGTVEPWSIAIAEVVIFTMALAWGLKMVALGELRIEKTPFNLCWLFVLGFGLFQVLPLPLQVIQIVSPKAHALYHEMAFDSGLNTSWRALSLYPYATKLELLRLLALALLFWVVANHLRTRQQVDRVVRLIMAVGFLLALFGIVQHFTWNGRLYWVRELTQGGNPFGPYVNRNHFSGYMEMVIPLTVATVMVGAQGQSVRRMTWRDRLLRWGSPEANRSMLLFFIALVMVAAFLLCGSRTGLYSFIGSMFLFWALVVVRHSTRARSWAILAGIVALGFGFAIWIGSDRVLQTLQILRRGTADPVAQKRFLLWHDTLRIGRDYPWSGSGLNTFVWIYPSYRNPRLYPFTYTHAENDYAQAFAEGGVPLVLILAVSLVTGATQLLRALWRASGRHSYILGIGLLAGLFALLLHSVADFNLHIMANAVLFVIILALAYRILVFGCRRTTGQKDDESWAAPSFTDIESGVAPR